MDHVDSHTDAVLTYNRSSMMLNIHSDSSYLSECKARSRAGEHFFMSDNAKYPENNGAVLNIAKIMKHVVTFAASAEIGARFINTLQAIPARRLLEEIGHKQPPTPTQTDNTTAIGFITKNLNPNMTRAEDMNHCFFNEPAR